LSRVYYAKYRNTTLNTQGTTLNIQGWSYTDHPPFSGSLPFALDSSAHISNLTGPTSTFRIGTVLPPIMPFPGIGEEDGIHGDVVFYHQFHRLGTRTLPGRIESSLISIVSVNVHSSGRGERLASE
jgi:hypothetical protein